MKNVILTGATGMIGSIVLQHCLDSNEIAKVTSIVRRQSGLQHPKLIEIIHSDFLDFSKIKNHFKNQDIAYFCLGVYTGAVPDAKFKEITFEYTKVFADLLKQCSPNVSFLFLSGAGADLTEKSRVSFARYKGMAENHLLSVNFKQLNIFRPGYIYPVNKRKEPNFAYRVFRLLYPFLKNIAGKNSSITSVELGKAMFESGFRMPEKVLLENKDILDFLNSLELFCC